jgi:hypothetical protein
MAIESSNYSGGIRTTNYDTSKVFIFNNSFEDGQINNDDYEDLVLTPGTLLGRVSATGLLVPLESAASDGSQYPVGILANNLTIEYGDTVDVRMCVAGEINANHLVLQGSDTLDTVIDGRRLRDRIGSDTVGVILREVTELGNFDNQ